MGTMARMGSALYGPGGVVDGEVGGGVGTC